VSGTGAVPLARRAAWILGMVSAGLLAASPATRVWARYQRSRDPNHGDDLPLLFDVNTEATIPTWYSALLLMAVAATCAALAALTRAAGPARRRATGRWWVLAAVFGAMSFDESVALHERLGDTMTGTFGLPRSGLLHHSWVAAGVVLGVVLVAVVAGSVASLPHRLRLGVLGGLGVFLTGALVLEAIGGAVLDAHGDGAAYGAVTLAEEGAEMAGTIVVLCALLSALDLRRDGDAFRLRLAADLSSSTPRHLRRDPAIGDVVPSS
jgi:hypothetical protein